MPKSDLTLAQTKDMVLEARRKFEALVAAGNPKAVAMKKRLDQAAKRMRKELRLPPGYEFRHVRAR